MTVYNHLHELEQLYVVRGKCTIIFVYLGGTQAHSLHVHVFFNRANRSKDYESPLDLLDDNSKEMLDLLDKDRLLPRNSDPDLGEHIIEVSACGEPILTNQ